MHHKWPIVGALAGYLLLTASRPTLAHNDVTNAINPYAVVSQRNVFHLQPPPPPPPQEVSKADLPVIRITGIIKIGNKPRALFVGSSKNSKESPTYFNLAAGEHDGILEVVRIHYGEETVDIINSGTPMTLTVKDDSLAKNDSEPPAPDLPVIPGTRMRANPNALHYPTMLPRPGAASLPLPTTDLPVQ
jgi:hypothetical protein